MGCADTGLLFEVWEIIEVAKQEWGDKRQCLGCGAKFYDMGRSPITCPSCDELLVVSTPVRSRRSRKDHVKEEPTQPANVEGGSGEGEEDVLSNEVDDLIEEEDEDDDIATLTDDDEDEEDNVLAEADIDTTKIPDE